MVHLCIDSKSVDDIDNV